MIAFQSIARDRAAIRWLLSQAETGLLRGLETWWDESDKRNPLRSMACAFSELSAARNGLIEFTAGRLMKRESFAENAPASKTAYPHLRELRRLTNKLHVVRICLHAGRYFIALSELNYIMARVEFHVMALERLAPQAEGTFEVFGSVDLTLVNWVRPKGQ